MRAKASGRAERVALGALVVTIVLTGTKLLVWSLTSSLAVLSQALDSALDIVALGLVWMGVRIAAKPADESHHYGHGKAENLAAFVQTVLLGLIVVFVGVQAIAELGGPGASVEVPWYVPRSSPSRRSWTSSEFGSWCALPKRRGPRRCGPAL